MAVIPIYIPTYISDQTYKPARVLPRLLFYNGQVECEPYWVQNQLAQQFEQSTFPYFDNYNVVSGSFPTVNSKSLLFYNEEASYGQTPTASLYSEYWSTYLNLLYNPLTKLINASAIIPLADYRELKQNDVVEFRSNYYHLRAINDYNLKNGECTIQLLGPILGDALNFTTKLFPKCFGYDVSDCDIACYSACECTDSCGGFVFNSVDVSDLIFTIKAEGPFVPNSPTFNFQLPIDSSKNYDFTINWGDGTSSYVSGSSSPSSSHQYATGSYTASISGLYQDFDVNNNVDDSARNAINGVHQFGNTGTTLINFGRTRNTINMDKVYTQPGQFTWENANSLFDGVAGGGITVGNIIPNNLFYYCTNVNSFTRAFVATRQLLNVPENLFNRAYEASSFAQAFFGANINQSNLVQMPSGSGFITSGSYGNFFSVFRMFFNMRQGNYFYSSSFDNIRSQAATLNANEFMRFSTGINPMSGHAPEFWNMPSASVQGTNAFENCTNLLNYAAIPPSFK